LDTQDFLETVKLWTETYREERDPDKDYSPAEEPEEKKWEINMMKIAAIISPADSVRGTPALEKVNEAVKLAKEKDPSKLKKIYENLHSVEGFLKSSL